MLSAEVSLVFNIINIDLYQTQDTLACLITSSIDDRHRPFVFHHFHNQIYNISDDLFQNNKLFYTQSYIQPNRYIYLTQIYQNQTYNSPFVRKKQIQFKQMILNQDKKTFVFQREQTQQSTIIDYEIDLRQLYVNLNYLLSIYCPLTQNKVSIYDPQNNCFVSLLKIGGQNGFIAKNYLEPKVILIRYKRALDYSMDSDIQSSVEHSSNNIRSDGRVKERTIAQAIQMVKKWRNFHLHGHKSTNRRMNLQEAAKLVGVPKKSLDDYYCQLRLGQFYNFDFASQLYDKMGVLRSYVKEYRPQKDKLRNQKHPKNLNIIEQFQLQTKTLRPIVVNQKPQNQQIEQQAQIKRDNEEIRITEERYEQLSNNQPLSKQLFNLEHQFFRGFQILMDEPNDPYADIDRDFSKKFYEQESNSFLYF